MDRPVGTPAEPNSCSASASENSTRSASARPRAVRIFVSSPSDVEAERQEVDAVIRGLNVTYASIVRLTTVRWEERSYTAGAGFQEQIPEAKDCDVVVAILGHRLGSPLGEDFPHRMADGLPYASGTVYEVLTALEAFDASQRPSVFAFRKINEPKFGPSDQAGFYAATREREKVDRFMAHWFEAPDGGSRRAVMPFGSMGEFQRKVRRALADWIETTFLGTREVVWDVVSEGSPFRALEPFDARHARVYFGRDRKVDHAMAALLGAVKTPEGRPFLLVVGASGSGKSSLVRAGVVPRLIAPGIVPDVGLWRVAVMRPGASSTPQLALAESLLETGVNDTGGFGPALPELERQGFAAARHLADILTSSHDAAAAVLISALDAAGETARQERKFEQPLRANLVLLVDQFEELFAASVEEAQRAGFAALLTVLTQTHRIWVVATLRADLFGHVVEESAMLELQLGGAQYLLRSPGLEELAEILRRSATDTGLTYERNDRTGETLDELLLADAAGSDTLPLVQFVLDQLFQRHVVKEHEGRPDTRLLTFAAYEELKGIDGVIDTVAEAALTDPKNVLAANTIEIELPRLFRSLIVRVYPETETSIAPPMLTVRTVPLKANSLDDPLIRTLRSKRILLTSNTGPDGGATMRLAHERVLKSWTRAREYTEKNQKYFMMERDLSTQLLVWRERARATDLLLPPGPLLTDAEEMRQNYGDELSLEMRDYIDASFRRDRWRQGLKGAGIAALVILALTASLFGITAKLAQDEAVQNYPAAKKAANTLVVSAGQQMRDLQDVNSKTLNIVFSIVDHLVGNIRDAVTHQRTGVPKPFQPAVAAVVSVMGGGTGGHGDLDALEALAKWEHAETYHKFSIDIQPVLQAARDSLDLRQGMWDAGDHSEELQWQLSLSHRLMGDLDRATAGQDSGRLAEARAEYDAALTLSRQLFTRDRTRLNYGREVTAILSRLGDLDLSAQPERARARYEEERDLSQEIFFANKVDVDSQKELAWAFNKMGSYWLKQRQFPLAQTAFSREVCIRRRIAYAAPDQTRSQQDLGWSLSRLGRAESAINPTTDAARNTMYEALEVRGRLAWRDAENPTWQREYAATLHDIAVYYGELNDQKMVLNFTTAEIHALRQAIPALQALIQEQFSNATKELADAERELKAAEERLSQVRQADGDDAATLTVERAEDEITIEQRKLYQQRQGAAQAEVQTCWTDMMGSLNTSIPATVTQ